MGNYRAARRLVDGYRAQVSQMSPSRPLSRPPVVALAVLFGSVSGCAPQQVQNPDESETAAELAWEATWETAPCPDWAPYDRERAVWTYKGDPQHATLTLDGVGAVTLHDRAVFQVRESDDASCAASDVYWACEPDGLHLAG